MERSSSVCSLPRTGTVRIGLSWPLLTLACLAATSAPSQEVDSGAASDHKVADVIPGAISPDGQLLSFTDFSTGDLAVQDLATEERRHLTHKGSWESSPEFAEVVQAISRDGSRVAYAWHVEGTCELRVIGLNGGEPRSVYRDDDIRCISPQDWSPDDEHILATFLHKDGVSQTVLVSAADGSVRDLPTIHSDSPSMSFSPDGRWIVYDAPGNEGSRARDIYLSTTEGGQASPLVEHPADDFVLGWAPDGSRVVFASDRNGSLAAWAISVEDGKALAPPVLLRADIAPIQNNWVGLSRDGSYFYGRATWDGAAYLAALDAETGAIVQAPEPLVSGVGRDTLAEWSPDGRSLAYVLGNGNASDPFVIGVRSLRNGEDRQLPLAMTMNRIGGHAFHPHWSRDGRFLLVQGRSRLGDRFFRIDADSGAVSALIQIDNSRRLEWPVWSADGTALYYRRSDVPYGEQAVVVRDLETGRERELYRGNFSVSGEGEPAADAEPTADAFPSNGGYQGASNLVVSPDGERLAFVWSEWTESALSSASLRVTSTVTGGDGRELYRAPPSERILQPAWMPDGRHLLFGRGRFDRQQVKSELWRISLEGGEPQYLGLELAGSVLYGLSVHPDGQRIAFTAGREMGTETWVMNGLLPERLP